MLCESRDPDAVAARSCGLSRAGLLQLRSLLAERGRNSWAVGDILVAAFGAPGPVAVHDGSTARLEALAEVLGCSTGWLVASRAAAASFPERERRLSVAFSVHRALAARPDRHVLLDRFVRQCERNRVVPSRRLLIEFLDTLDTRRERRQRIGRPRVPNVDRLANMALRQLDHDEIVALIAKLNEALTVASAAA